MLRTLLAGSVLLLIAGLRPLGTHAFHDLFRREAKDHHDWNYEEDDGPQHWPKMFKICAGSNQSPIDIDKDEANANENLDQFEFKNYEKPLEGAVISNNGHTIKVSPGPKDAPRLVKEGGMADVYQFEQLHFHWGSDSKKGSEHTMDGKAFPMEMHLVHRNTDYKSLQAASQKDGGIAVLAVLFKLDNKDNPDLEPIIDKLDDVRKEGAHADMDDFNLASLIPDDLFPYYRYDGSLTTPPCLEVVTWTVFEEKLPISEKQLQQFRNVKEEEDDEPEENLVNNFRPVQPLNQRVVQVSADHHSSGTTLVATPLLLLFSLLAFFN